MSIRIFSLTIFSLVVIFLGTGCTLSFSKSGSDGVIKSSDFGVSWKSKSLLISENGRKVRLSKINVTKILIHPSNSQLLFLGTRDYGLFVSENGADSWVQIVPNQYVVDIAVDPAIKCTFFFATQKRILKTDSCGKRWEIVFNETRDQVSLSSMVLDYKSPDVLYAATTFGDIYKTVDKGVTWTILAQFQDRRIDGISIDRHNQNILYAVARDGALYQSLNRGVAWTDIAQSLRDMRPGTFRNLQGLSGKGRLLYVGEQGLFVTQNNGASWKAIQLLTPLKGRMLILGAVNPQDDKDYYYATNDTFYHSSDNGAHWNAVPISQIVTRVPSYLAMDSTNPSVIYMGYRTIEEQNPYWYYGENGQH
jgi:photosystem II stability/assembly factor-like uncharacterized protein